MPLQTKGRAPRKWRPEDELELELMTDDDFEVDEFDDEDDVLAEEPEARAEPAGNVPVWRLIEMSRENRFLQRELADFEDYDAYDSWDDSGRHVH